MASMTHPSGSNSDPVHTIWTVELPVAGQHHLGVPVVSGCGGGVVWGEGLINFFSRVHYSGCRQSEPVLLGTDHQRDVMLQQVWAKSKALRHSFLGTSPAPALRLLHVQASAEVYKKLAEKNGMSLTELSLRWCKERRAVTSTLLGQTSMEQLEEVCPLSVHHQLCWSSDAK